MISERDIIIKNLGLPSLNFPGLEIVRAENIYLYDKNGKKYIDLISGVSVSNLGHLNPAVVAAIKDQVDRYMHLMVYGEFIQSPQIRLANQLAGLLPEDLNCTYFVNSGSESIEGALKLAKRYTRRTEIIAFRNAYHGGTQGALSILGHEELKNAFRPLLPDIRLLEFNNTSDLSAITERTACVVAETIQAEAGIILPVNNFLRALRKRCDETGTLLIIDDIQMGFGRTGKLFSFENFSVSPDILCLAKAMGGGMPIGAFISSEEIMRSLTRNPELGHITTFGGHPVSCAAALANLEQLTRSGLIEKVNHKGELFIRRLKDHPNIKEIRGIGLMLAVEITNGSKMNELYDMLIKNGIIVDKFLFNSSAFRIAPPLIISNDQIIEICDLINGTLDQLN